MKKIKHFFQRVLYFLRLTDGNGSLSITNIACGIVLYKIATEANPSVSDMGSLLVTLTLYYGKAHLNSKKQSLTDENKQAIQDIQTKVQQISDKTSGLALHVGMRGNPLGK